jgi:NAD(P)-dependent dehydrogenase (short-subunit alcohol dehydrogenase family)
MKNISGKTVILPSAAAGVGLAIATALAEARVSEVMADIQKMRSKRLRMRSRAPRNPSRRSERARRDGECGYQELAPDTDLPGLS